MNIPSSPDSTYRKPPSQLKHWFPPYPRARRASFHPSSLASEKPLPAIPRDLLRYLRSPHSIWFWKIVLVTFISLLVVFLIPENVTPWIYLRYFFGAVVLLFLPGYCMVRALVPVKGAQANPKLLDNIERMALSLGVSIALTPLTALFLNYTPWGIATAPVILSLCGLTLSLALIAVGREYRVKR